MKKILIIDDDAGILVLLHKKLESAGFLVQTALDGVSALVCMRANSPDLVILDVLIPRLDGYSFMSEVRSDERLRHIPLIVITGRGELKDVFQVENVAAFFEKPLNIEEVLRKARALTK